MNRLFIIVMFFPFVAFGQQTSVLAGRQLANRYFEEVWNNGNINVLDEILTKDYINHTPSIAGLTSSKDLKAIVLGIRKAFPDLHYQIKDVVIANGYITIRTVMTGTQTDSLFNLPPTNKKIEVNQINIEKLKAGKIAEHWRVTDELTMMKQLGFYK